VVSSTHRAIERLLFFFVQQRVAPLGRSPRASGPMATRRRRSTSMFKCSSIRRIWRFLPSSRIISSQNCARPGEACERFSRAGIHRRLRGFHSQCFTRFIGDGIDLHVIRLIEMCFRRGDVRRLRNHLSAAANLRSLCRDAPRASHGKFSGRRE